MPHLFTTARPAAREVAWRRERLRSAGMPEEVSRALARSTGHDLHRVLGLVENGCPVATALRITARYEQASA
jgi:hypothetical protein